MAKFILSTDSGCDLQLDTIKKIDANVIPMAYSIDGVDFKDTMKSEDLDAFYKKMQEGAVPKTASIAIGEFYEHFKAIAKENLPIVHISLGSGISGTYSNGLQAIEMLKSEGFENEIVLIDSKCASAGYGLMVIKAAEMRDSGATAEKVAEHLEATKLGVSPYYTTPDLTYLYRGGRVSKGSMIIAHALGIQPILNLDHEGRLGVCAKTRGQKQCYAKILDYIKEFVIEPEKQTLYVSHSHTPEKAAEIGELIKNELGFADVFYTEIGTIIGSHTGPGLVAVFFSGKERTGSYEKQ